MAKFRHYFRGFIGALVIWPISGQAADAELPSDYCEQSLYGEKVAADIELNQLVSDYFVASAPDDLMQIRLRHNDNDQASECAETIKNWLVALGFTLEQIQLEADNSRSGSFRLDLLD